jgi:hypothetical protein
MGREKERGRKRNAGRRVFYQSLALFLEGVEAVVKRGGGREISNYY